MAGQEGFEPPTQWLIPVVTTGTLPTELSGMRFFWNFSMILFLFHESLRMSDLEISLRNT